MTEQHAAASNWLNRALNGIERVGNKLPDPAILFAIFMIGVWLISAWMSTMTFTEVDPRTQQPIVVQNMLSGAALTAFMANLVNTFVTFPPLGVVLVAMLGLGVAEYTGFINAGLRAILSVTPRMLLTPVLIAVGILSHVAVDAGYVLVIPLGAVIFYAAGWHRGGVRRRLRWLFRNAVHSIQSRSNAGRINASRCTFVGRTRRCRTGDQSAEQHHFHLGFDGADHRHRLGVDRFIN